MCSKGSGSEFWAFFFVGSSPPGEVYTRRRRRIGVNLALSKRRRIKKQEARSEGKKQRRTKRRKQQEEKDVLEQRALKYSCISERKGNGFIAHERGKECHSLGCRDSSAVLLPLTCFLFVVRV